MTSVLSGAKSSRPSKIWRVTRNDSPSVVLTGSSDTESAPRPKTKVSVPAPPPPPPPPPWMVPPPPQPATPSSVAPARPAPLNLRKSRRLMWMLFLAKACSLLTPSDEISALRRTVSFALPRRHLEERAPRVLAPSQPVGRVVGLARGLRQAVPGGAGEHQLDGTVQVYPVSHGDVDWRDPRPRPHCPTHDFPAVHQVRDAALLDLG